MGRYYRKLQKEIESKVEELLKANSDIWEYLGKMHTSFLGNRSYSQSDYCSTNDGKSQIFINGSNFGINFFTQIKTKTEVGFFFKREKEILEKEKKSFRYFHNHKSDKYKLIHLSEYNSILIKNKCGLDSKALDFFSKMNSSINELIKENKAFVETEKKRKSEIAKNRRENLKKSKNKALLQFDKDGNGKLDTVEVEDEFLKLLKKHQPKIIETDKSYIQQFVKISEYHKTQRKNLQTIFENISKTKKDLELNKVVDLLKEQIHSYESLLFHSFNMITSLVNDDLVTFYQIHNSFDKLNIFNSNHQTELMDKLNNIEDGLYTLISSIRSMEVNIINELNNLSYITEISFENLAISVNEELKSIGSSIDTNNLLLAINTYQNYSTNRRLKS
jgi:hypothetical protein